MAVWSWRLGLEATCWLSLSDQLPPAQGPAVSLMSRTGLIPSWIRAGPKLASISRYLVLAVGPAKRAASFHFYYPGRQR